MDIDYSLVYLVFQIQSYSQNPRLRLSDYELTENRGRLQGMPPFRLSVDSSDEDSSMTSSFGQVVSSSQHCFGAGGKKKVKRADYRKPSKNCFLFICVKFEE